MPRGDLYAPGFAQRLKLARVQRGLTQERLAQLAGTNAETVARYESGRVHPQSNKLEKLAEALDVEADYLRLGEVPNAGSREFYKGKQTSVAIDEVVENRVHLMDGNHTVPLEINARYTHQPVEIPKRFRPVYDDWLSRERKMALEKGFSLFNGPNTRLIRGTFENTRQDPRGHEQSGIMLELGPVSWFDWTVLNMFLDEPFAPRDPDLTPRAVFADLQRLCDNGSDLRWCRLSNILTVNMTPISSDGYGLIQLRNKRGVSTTGGRLANGVAENIHRYLDEAPSDNLALRQNALQPASSCTVDASYASRGVPSPLLAAQRGLWEEISEELYWATRENVGAYKFLNLTMDLEFFNPHLVGVVELGLTRSETEKLVRRSPGKDKARESIAIHYLPLDAKDKETMRVLADQNRWAAIGLACVITGIQYYQSKRSSKDRPRPS